MLVKRIAPFLLLFILISTFAVACESQNNKDITSNTTPHSTTPATLANPGPLSVLGIWSGDELSDFKAMVKPWEQEQGGKLKFTGTRNITDQLSIQVQGGKPPDVAIPASLGLYKQYAKAGKIISLGQCHNGLEQYVRDNYPKAYTEMATVNGKLYGFFMKAASDAGIWYSPKWFSQNGLKPLTKDSSWDDLLKLSNEIKAKGVAPWSMGMESGATSGWPGTDWIQQIILNQEGAETYDGLINGTVKFTDPKVKDAWQKFGHMALTPGLTAQGSGDAIDATNFQKSIYLPFDTPPRAGMVFMGGFAAGFIHDQFPNTKPDKGYAFFPWPGGEVTFSANIVYAFKATPTVCSFLKYLASAKAQTIWVKKGGFTSLNSQVSLDEYPNEVDRASAKQLFDSKDPKFDLDDAIGGKVQQAYFQGVIQYLKDPTSLDSILSGIEAIRSGQ